MKKADAIAYFGSAAELARKLGITEAAVSKWGENVPNQKSSAQLIEELTGGALKADAATPSGQSRPSLRVAPGTPLDSIPSVKRAAARTAE
ncbi:Cro/CI family transcriptional regulator [Aeromonas sp. 6P]|uniref:Cro/CI family transcriptional regulator n=1 Tax=Aeromonas sp. 6P TaxID=3452722 RepID=UPI003F78E437